MIKDWNHESIKPNEVFHFQHSLRPFISLTNVEGNWLFVDINEGISYSFDDLEYECLEFYTKEDDEDFMGVKMSGKLVWTD